jgi:hypothetical protein
MVAQIIYLWSGEDAGVVDRCPVGVEQSEVMLGHRAGLQVLVEEGEPASAFGMSGVVPLPTS